MADHLDQLRKLADHVKRIAKEMNLEVPKGAFMVVPGEVKGDNDILQVTFIMTPESVETLEETTQRKVDAQFEDIFGASFSDKEKKAFLSEDELSGVEIEESEIENMMNDLKDFLGNDDDD